MSALPQWVDRTLAKMGVHTERYGRDRAGAPKALDRKWFFCGWYWHVGTKRQVTKGPFGPFPCWSAALLDAATQLGVNMAEAPLIDRARAQAADMESPRKFGPPVTTRDRPRRPRAPARSTGTPRSLPG